MANMPSFSSLMTANIRDGAKNPDRKQRQAQHGEIIAVDRLKQLHTKPFELVRAHALGGGGTGRIEIAIRETHPRRSHRQPRGTDVFEQHRCILHEGNG